jgi:hypothetical protein
MRSLVTTASRRWVRELPDILYAVLVTLVLHLLRDSVACGTTNFGDITATQFDVSRRRTFDADASYLVSNFGGRHQFKGGMQWNGVSNAILRGREDLVIFRFGPSHTIAGITGNTDVPTAPALSVPAGCSVLVHGALPVVITSLSTFRTRGSLSAV